MCLWMPSLYQAGTKRRTSSTDGTEPNAKRGRPAVEFRVDRERLMTDGEAAAANGQLPAGFLYVPTEALGGGGIGAAGLPPANL